MFIGRIGLNMQDKANPLATVLSAAMLLKYGLGEQKAADRIETAVLDTLNRGFRTGDIYSEGNVCTSFFFLTFHTLVILFITTSTLPPGAGGTHAKSTTSLSL